MEIMKWQMKAGAEIKNAIGYKNIYKNKDGNSKRHTDSLNKS